MMHDWKNNTLLLQSQDIVVKANLKDGKVRLVIPRGSELSSWTSIATHILVESHIPLELSLDYVMNWMESLATIDYLMLNVNKPIEEMDKEECPYIRRYPNLRLLKKCFWISKMMILSKKKEYKNSFTYDT